MNLPQNDPRWRKAARSQNEGACVELHPAGAVRDSKNPAAGVLIARLTDLVDAVKAGQLDR